MRTTNYVPQSRNGNGHLDPCAYEWGAESLLHSDDIPDGSEGADVANFRGNVVPFPPKPNGHGDLFIPPNLGPEPRPTAAIVPATTKRGGDFLKEYEPISYTLGGIAPSGSLYGLTGPTGKGKTALLIACSIAVIKGNDEGGPPISKVIGCEVERGRVAYITKENSTDFRMKLAVNCYVHGIDRDFLNEWLTVLDGRADSPESICEALRRDAEANGLFQLVNYDTFQAGYAAEPGAKEFNENLGVLRFIERLRPLCEIIGKPTEIVAFHPTKNATEDQLIPFGGGSIYNDLDGNLTLWGDAAHQIKLGWTKVRGPQFEPRYFRIEQLSCPDIFDKKGHQILLPVMRPTTAIDAEERAANETANDIALLHALLVNPKASRRELAQVIGIPKSTIDRTIKKLEGAKMVAFALGVYTLSERAKKLLDSIS